MKMIQPWDYEEDVVELRKACDDLYIRACADERRLQEDLKAEQAISNAWMCENDRLEKENNYLKEERRHLEKSLEMFKGQSKEKENEALREALKKIAQFSGPEDHYDLAGMATEALKEGGKG